MPRRRYKQLTRTDRLRIETLSKAGHKPKEIAEEIGVHRSTIYREFKRGEYEHRNTDWTTSIEYSSDKAHQRAQEKKKNKGPGLKIGSDIAYSNYLENKMLEGFSPEAAIALAKKEGFQTKISKQTLYKYIDDGLFITITNRDLLVKGKRKKRKKKVRRVQKKDSAGTSIEKRPDSVNTREDFGDWEMDSVVGPQGKSKCALLVLTERKTRDEIIKKLPDHTAGEVVKALDALEQEWGSLFKMVFKSITVDNGVEFSFVEELERSFLETGEKRTKLYYCHAFCSSERGSNENLNRMIRRKIPKGTNFDSMTDEEIKDIEDWMNDYPRGIFGYDSARERFQKELEGLTA